MRWFKEHKKTATIMILFFVLIVVVLVSHQTFGTSNVAGRFAGDIITTIQTPFAKFGRFMADKFGGSFANEDFQAENEVLQERIRELEQELARERLSAADLEELRKLSDALNYTDLYSTYAYVTGDVIALDNANGFTIFTINVGAKQGISQHDVVINGDGLIGRIMAVDTNASKVISIIDESNKVGFQVSRDANWLGVSQGDGNGGLTGYMLSDEAIVLEGDRLITSGIGGIYPPGLTLGKVTHVEWTLESPLKIVTIEPAASFQNIRKVTVLI